MRRNDYIIGMKKDKKEGGSKMKCEICQRRKATATVFDEEIRHEYQICKQCRREFYPTWEEEKEDKVKRTYQAEFQAELDAGCYNLP